MSASIKIVLYKSKTLSNGEHPIMLRITKDRKLKYIGIGHNCLPEMWDTKKNLPKKKHPHFKELLILIDKKKIEANKLLLDLDNLENDYSAEVIRYRLKNSTKYKSVFKYFDEVINRLEKSKRIGYANVFKSTKNSLYKFNNNQDLEFADVNNRFINKYEADFLSRGVSLNSIFVFMRTFKTLLNYARNEGVVKTEYNPFKEISFTKYRRVKTKKRAITKDQIKAIIELNYEDGTSLFHSKNYFLFSFFNRGINFIDIAFLKWNAINGDKLTYTRRKTKEPFNIRMLEPAIDILEYYNLNFKHSENEYVFPILNESHQSAKAIDYRLDRVLKIVNKDLKTIGQEAGIKDVLTTYVARHSYATIMKQSGVSLGIISEAMGHESEKTTQIYLESFDNKILDEASKAIL